jgi:hypothetical protein
MVLKLIWNYLKYLDALGTFEIRTFFITPSFI